MLESLGGDLGIDKDRKFFEDLVEIPQNTMYLRALGTLHCYAAKRSETVIEICFIRRVYDEELVMTGFYRRLGDGLYEQIVTKQRVEWTWWDGIMSRIFNITINQKVVYMCNEMKRRLMAIDYKLLPAKREREVRSDTVAR